MRIDDFEVRKTSKDKCSVTKYYGDAENLVIPETIGEFVPVEIGKGLVRKSLKAIRKDLYLVGEDWDDSEGYMFGDMWDATMNYYGSAMACCMTSR